MWICLQINRLTLSTFMKISELVQLFNLYTEKKIFIKTI